MTQVERYIVRGENDRRGEWAFIYLDEERGVFSAVSSFGNYAHIWSHRGDQRLKEFLRDLDFDYFMGKTRGLDYRRFDHEATVKGIKAYICDQRRQGAVDKKHARSAWRELEDMEHENSADLFGQALYNSEHLYDLYGGDIGGALEHRPDGDSRGFWSAIWPEFLKQLPA
jgi:hypothetical protein